MFHPFKADVERVVALLTAGAYDELASWTNGKRLSSVDLAAAVQSYGRTLIQPPSEAFNSLDVVRIKDAQPPAWSVRVDLWSEEDGRSYLTLELTVRRSENGYDVEVDDLHVL
jgi:hypothetical protein